MIIHDWMVQGRLAGAGQDYWWGVGTVNDILVGGICILRAAMDIKNQLLVLGGSASIPIFAQCTAKQAGSPAKFISTLLTHLSA
jgi:hypothetical protein